MEGLIAHPTHILYDIQCFILMDYIGIFLGNKIP
jgi:hypothetical protein